MCAYELCRSRGFLCGSEELNGSFQADFLCQPEAAMCHSSRQEGRESFLQPIFFTHDRADRSLAFLSTCRSPILILWRDIVKVNAHGPRHMPNGKSCCAFCGRFFKNLAKRAPNRTLIYYINSKAFLTTYLLSAISRIHDIG